MLPRGWYRKQAAPAGRRWGRSAFIRTGNPMRPRPHAAFFPQHFLYFLPLPQGQGSLRPTRGASLTIVLTLTAVSTPPSSPPPEPPGDSAPTVAPLSTPLVAARFSVTP